jgi:hypothetical protein
MAPKNYGVSDPSERQNFLVYWRQNRNLARDTKAKPPMNIPFIRTRIANGKRVNRREDEPASGMAELFLAACRPRVDQPRSNNLLRA